MSHSYVEISYVLLLPYYLASRGALILPGSIDVKRAAPSTATSLHDFTYISSTKEGYATLKHVKMWDCHALNLQ